MAYPLRYGFSQTIFRDLSSTRRLSYRKDDRAMRPIYGALKIFESPWVRPRLLFPKFLMGLCSDLSYECAYKNLKFVALPVPEIIAIEVFGLHPPILGKRRPYGSALVPFEKALVSFIVTVPLSLRVSEMLLLLCCSTPLFPIAPPHNFPMFPSD